MSDEAENLEKLTKFLPLSMACILNNGASVKKRVLDMKWLISKMNELPCGLDIMPEAFVSDFDRQHMAKLAAGYKAVAERGLA